MRNEHRARRPGRLRRLAARAAQRIRELFSSTPPERPGDSGTELGGLGVREPRRPLKPTLSGAVALEPPPAETRDVRAVGEEPD